MQKILIVQEGQWGSVKPEAYRETAKILKRALDKAEAPSRKPGEKEKAAEVTIVETAKEAVRLVHQGGIDVLMFLSRGNEAEAEELAAKYPRTWSDSHRKDCLA